MCHFLRQTSPEMDSAFRHGEAPWQERELRTLAPLTLEVERNRNAATPLRKFPGHQTSQPDSFHFIQCNLVLCSIVKSGCSRRLMAGHLLGVLEPSVVLQVNRDTGSPPDVTSDGGEKARRLGARFRIATQALYRSKRVPLSPFKAN